MSKTIRRKKEGSIPQKPVSFQMPIGDHAEMMDAVYLHGLNKSLFIRKSIKFAIIHKWNKEGVE